MKKILVTLVVCLAVGLLICADQILHIEGMPLLCICTFVVVMTILSVHEIERHSDKCNQK